MVHQHASQTCAGSSSTQGSSPLQTPSSSSCSTVPVVSAGHRRNHSNGGGNNQQQALTTSEAVGTPVQYSACKGITASRMVSQACQTPENSSSTHLDSLQDQLLAALGSDSHRSTHSSRERQSPGGAVFGGTSSGVSASFKLSSSPPHRPHLPTHSKTSNATLVDSGSLGAGGCRNPQPIACSDASISSSITRNSDSFPAVGVGTEAHTTSNDHPLNVVPHSMSSAHCSPINRGGGASSGQSFSPSCSAGRGPPLSTGHLLKPSNVAFLSHHQTGVRKSSRDNLHDDEGTPC